MQSDSDRIPDLLVYGGTFDPPHLGHRHCMEQAVKTFPRADLLILPGYQSAGAGGLHKTTATAFDHRLEMSRINFSGLNQGGQKLEVSELEKDLPSPNYSYRTMREVRLRYPQKLPLFVMGEDQWTVFDKWKNPERFLEESSVLVVPRSGQMDKKALIRRSLDMLRRMGMNAELAKNACPIDLPGTGQKIWVSDAVPIQVSSTKIRNHIEATQERTLNSEFLHAGVLRYIEQHQLYRGE